MKLQTGTILIAGCERIVLHPVDGSNAEIEMPDYGADARPVIEPVHDLLLLM
jgi:hypothetical protein